MVTNVIPTFSLVRYEPHHAEDLLLHGALYSGWVTMRRSHLVTLDNGDAATLLHDGQPLACFGILKVWHGYGEAWAILATDAIHHKKCIFRALRASLRFAIHTGQYHRIQCSVIDSFAPGKRLAEHLGFTFEYAIPHAGPSREPLNLYSILVR